MVGTSGGTSVAPDADRPGRGGGCRAERRRVQRPGRLEAARPARAPPERTSRARPPPSRSPPRPRESWPGRVSTSASCRPTCWFAVGRRRSSTRGSGAAPTRSSTCSTRPAPGWAGCDTWCSPTSIPTTRAASPTSWTGRAGNRVHRGGRPLRGGRPAPAYRAEGRRRGLRTADRGTPGHTAGPRGGLRRGHGGRWSRATR